MWPVGSGLLADLLSSLLIGTSLETWPLVMAHRWSDSFWGPTVGKGPALHLEQLGKCRCLNRPLTQLRAITHRG